MELLQAIGSLICHQLPEKTLYVDALRLWVCWRCSGIYFGFAITTVGMFLLRRSKRVTNNIIVLFVIASICNLIDAKSLCLTDIFFSFYLGVLLGTSISLILSPMWFRRFFKNTPSHQTAIFSKSEKVLSIWFIFMYLLLISSTCYVRNWISLTFLNVFSFIGFNLLGLFIMSIGISRIIEVIRKYRNIYITHRGVISLMQKKEAL